jgi:hypothetical protein
MRKEMSLANHVCNCTEGCIKNSTQNVFSVYGAKTSYSLQNAGEKDISKYIVDDCLLAGLPNDKKCDYLFVVTNDGNRDGYFVELKGSDVPTAIKQLINSINHLRNNINGNFFARIVCSKFPKAPIIKSSHPYLKLMRMTADELIIRSQSFSESI